MILRYSTTLPAGVTLHGEPGIPLLAEWAPTYQSPTARDCVKVTLWAR